LFLVIVSCLFVGVRRDARADEQPAGSQPAATAAAAPAGTQPTSMGASGDLDEVVINGIRRGDLILPTTVTSGSAYGWTWASWTRRVTTALAADRAGRSRLSLRSACRSSLDDILCVTLKN
jgi:hypothetical protein